MSFLYNAIFGAPSTTNQPEEPLDEGNDEEPQPYTRVTKSHVLGVGVLPRLPDVIEEPSEVVIEGPVRFYVLNTKAGEFDRVLAESRVRVAKLELFSYRLDVLDEADNVVFVQMISSDMNMHLDRQSRSVVWTREDEESVSTWSVVFDDVALEKQFKRELTVAQYESRRGALFAKSVHVKDRDWVMSANDAGEEGGEDDEEDDDDGDGDVEMTWAYDDDEEGGWQSQDEDDKYSHVTRTPARSTKRYTVAQETEFGQGRDQNDALAVGMALNRSFVVRGSKIGVFKHDEDDQLEYLTSLPELRTASGELLSPTKGILHERDNKMLLLSGDERNKVYCMDLERGQVIEEWQALDDVKVRDVNPLEKYAQRTSEQLFLGANHNQVFTMDPRINSKNKLAAGKTYSRPPKFTCVVANGEGEVAAGSQTGEIRLFSDVSKNAKTLLPGLGDPIIGMDVTEDGHWVLATTERYILLVPTEHSNGRTGFEASMRNHDKPKPFKLQIHPRDMAKHNIRAVKFTTAHFNMGTNIREAWIVSSTGPYIVTWNLASAKKGRVFDYRIKHCPQSVVADQFRFGKEDQVVVTMEDDVFLQKMKRG